jgi:phospho-N-acetylmuramoyl-pentapeptide-transferase
MGPLALLLGLLLVSFIVTSLLIVPFINTLYYLRFQRANQKTRDAFGMLTPIFDSFHKAKAGTPVGGGLLVIAVVSILFAILLPVLQMSGINITSVHQNNQAEINILFFTFLSFGLLGLYDDIKKFFGFEKEKFFGLKMKYKLALQVLLGVIISCMMYYSLGISFIHLPIVNYTLHLGIGYIPFATFVIVAFANAVNITDGLDGLAAGSLMICLFGLWILSGSILDIPLSIFIALWLGSLISFLYFNVFPARMFMGDVGALAFGATLAVVGLLLGKMTGLVIVGFIFVVEVFSSLAQLLSKKYLNRKIFPVAPIHLTFQKMGWEEPKIVQRAWLVQIMLTIFGVWLSLL